MQHSHKEPQARRMQAIKVLTWGRCNMDLAGYLMCWKIFVDSLASPQLEHDHCEAVDVCGHGKAARLQNLGRHVCHRPCQAGSEV